MEEEIDLRPYVLALLNYWKWILGLAFITSIIIFILLSLTVPQYQATVYVAITDSREVVQLDSRIREDDQLQPSRAFPELAVSDEMLQMLFSELGQTTTKIDTIDELRGMLEADLGDDVRLLILKAASPDKQEAAHIANVWGEQFVPWANQIFSTQNTSQLPLLREQLIEQEEELIMAEIALIEFEARNQTRIISNTLAFYTTTQTSYLKAQLEANSLLADAQRLYGHLQTVDNEAADSVAIANQITSLLLQLKLFKLDSDAAMVAPFSLQINDVDSLTGQTRAEQVAFLANLIESLTIKSGEMEVQLADLEPKILEGQRTIQEVKTESARLSLRETLAREAYTALAYKVEEEQLTTQNFPSSLRLASRANVPDNPVSSGRLLTPAVAFILGLFASCGWIIARKWWQLNFHS